MNHKAIIVLTNKNSDDYIELARLSLFTAFLTAQATKSAKTTIILLDDASNDTSFDQLRSFGEELSARFNVEFYSYRFERPKGHPYALYFAYMLALSHFHADFLFKIDNDFLIVDFKILDKMINIANVLKRKNLPIFSIAPATLTCSRNLFPIFKLNLNRIIKEGKCNLGGFNKTTINGAIFREDLDCDSHFPPLKLLPTLFTYSSAFMIDVSNIRKYVKNPFLPLFLKVYFDDTFAGIIMARKGFPSFLYTGLGGIHYTGTHKKISNETLYCFFYNLSLLRSLLYGYKGEITLLSVVILASLALRFPILRKFISVLEKRGKISLSSIEKHIMEIKEHDYQILSKTIIVGSFKGLINSRKYKRLVKNFFVIDDSFLKSRSELEKYLPCTPITKLKDILCIVLSLFHVI
jgi:hypothetical protein